MQNLFKRAGTFKCVHDIHRHFRSEMSPYHVLVQKNCYPDGCVYFQWKCRLLAKQKTCFRNFEKVGRNCFNCRYFYEEKVHQYPEPMISDDEYAKFTEEFDEFVEWMQTLQHKRVLCEGIVSSIKPDLAIEPGSNRNKIVLRGFLVSFNSGYLDNQLFEDSFYLSISALTQNKLRIRSGDNIEFEANLILDRGRLKFIKSGRFNFFERGTTFAPQKGELLIALNTSTVQHGQPAKCLGCSKGILADKYNLDSGPNREIVCLLGMPDYRLCTYVEDDKQQPDDTCANPKWNSINCSYTL